MGISILFNWVLKNTQFASLHQKNTYLQLLDIMSNFTFIFNEHQDDRNYYKTIQKHNNDSAILTADILSLGFYILALSSRSSFQLRHLKYGVCFWVKRLTQLLLVVAAFIMGLPVIVMCLATLFMYKKFVGQYLNKTLLCGSDAVWALDADETKSREIINVLIILEGEMSLEDLTQIVKQRLLPASKKLHLNRLYSTLGYFYWKSQDLDISSRVRFLEGCREGEEMTEDDLRVLLSSKSNLPLPDLHAAGWEVLLGPRLSPHLSTRTTIIFRVHHSMGDGPALCRMLISFIADQPTQNMTTELVTTLSRKKLIKASHLSTINDAANAIASQLFPPDHGPLHGDKLNGEKHLCWRGSEELMKAARKIRSSTGVSFTAGLLAALTSAVAEYAIEQGMELNYVPLTVVVPSRLPDQYSKAIGHELDNSFSFAMVRTLLSSANTSPKDRVLAADIALKNANQPATLILNSWALHLAGGLLPIPLAKKVLYSGRCTAVLSNMPGPSKKISLLGRVVSDLAFFVPHRGTTGVGASVLSYAGKLTLTLTIDGALLTSPGDVQNLTRAWEHHLLLLASNF